MITNKILLGIFLVSFFLLVGCADAEQTPKGTGMGGGQQLNLTSEEKDTLTADRIAQALAECADKVKGDACTIESPRGLVESVCNLMDEGLICGQAGIGTKTIE